MFWLIVGDAHKEHDKTPCSPPVDGVPGQVCGMPPLVTQIWDGQVQAPTFTPPPAVLLAPTPAPIPVPAPAPIPVPVPAPAPPAEAPSPPLPPLVSEIFDGQLQSPEEPTPEPEPIVFPLISEVGSSQIQALETTPSSMTLTPVTSPTAPNTSVPPPVSSSPIPLFQGSAGRIMRSGATGWIIFAIAMHLAI